MKIRGLPKSPAFRQAILVAGLMMGWQVAAKATRDSLFLAQFLPSALPAVIGASAVCSILMALLGARLIAAYGPSRVIPSAYLVGGVLHGAEWTQLSMFPRVTAALVYVHIVAFGALLLSGFWALANERFDPRQARRRFGQIAAFGTLGSLVGGLLAERVASLGSSADLLILLGGLQIACFAALLRFAPGRTGEPVPESLSIPEVISGAPYLAGLAGFVLLVSMSAGTLDYLFKVQAVARFGRGVSLGRFFALFYAATSVVTFVIQAGATRFWLSRYGPGRTAATLPMAVAGASAVSMLLPGATALAISRAIEQSLRGSLFRSGYELFFTPMPQAEKRSTKSVIDVGADRLGEGLAAATIQLLLALPAALVSSVLLALTALLSAAAAWLAFRLERAYVLVLEKALAKQTISIAPEEAGDFVTRSIVMQGMTLMGQTVLAPGTDTRAVAFPVDPAMQRLLDLRSDEPARVRAALRSTVPLPPIAVPYVIELLGRDEFARPAHDALCKVSDRIAGQLIDCLCDTSADFKIRRRIPGVLGSCGSAAAWDGLFRQLNDGQFEIRVRCARALEKMLKDHPEYQPEQVAVFEIVGQALARAPRAGAEPNSEQMAHVATLLGLVLQEPVRLAFRALRADNTQLRSHAVEYLDSVLPRALFEQLAPHVESWRPGQSEGDDRRKRHRETP